MKQSVNIILSIAIFTLLILSCEKGKIVITDPPKPSGFIVDTIHYGALQFSWQPSTREIDSFRFYRQIGYEKRVLLASLPPDSLSYLDIDIKSDITKNYRYILQSIINSAYSEGIIFNYLPKGPASPYNVNAQLAQGTTILHISWDFDSDKFAEGILIERKNNNSYWVPLSYVEKETKHYDLIAPVKPNDYKISSYAGEFKSAPVQFQFDGLVPPVDSLFGIKISANTIKLTWKDNSDFEFGYYIYKGYAAYTNATLHDSLPANTEEYIDQLYYSHIDTYYGVVGHYNGKESAIQYILIPGVQ